MPKRIASQPFAFLLLCVLLNQSPFAKAQEVFAPPSATFITRFSFFQLTGGVVMFRGCVAPYADSLNFLLDTGSGGISLDSGTVAYLNIPSQASERTIRGIGGIKTVKFAYNRTMLLPGLEVDSLNFHINDYESLSAVYGVRVDGIIGYSFFRRYIVKIDYDKMFIEVYTPGVYKYPRGGHILRPAITGLPIQPAIVGESREFFSRFYLDTGAGLCLLLSEEYCSDSSLFAPGKKKFTTVAEGLGGKKSMDITVLKTFKIGPYKFKKVPIYIFDDEYNITSYPFLGGLIGNDLMRRFNLVINYPKAEIHLVPNTHFRDFFDYSYTGMGLYSEGRQIYISDVIPGSPADEAGLKTDDMLIAIDNLFGGSLQAYKTKLQVSGNKMRVMVRRNDQIIETRIKVKSIL